MKKSILTGIALSCVGALSALGSGLVAAVEIKGDSKAVSIARHVYERPDGQSLKRSLKIELIDANGDKRERTAVVLRDRNGKEKRTVFMYDSPRSIKGTAFLSKEKLDGTEARDQFLYLPSLKRERRIPSSERGDYFLGTDFTYEDVKNELKFDPADYEFSYVGEMNALVGNQRPVIIEGKARSDQKAKELGYSHFEATVDSSNWMVIKADFFDLKKQKLKTVTVEEVEKIDGIPTAKRISVKNHQTGHTTRFAYSNIKYLPKIDGDLFEFETISKGPKLYE